MIRLLRDAAMPGTFSTVSARTGPASLFRALDIENIQHGAIGCRFARTSGHGLGQQAFEFYSGLDRICTALRRLALLFSSSHMPARISALVSASTVLGYLFAK